MTCFVRACACVFVASSWVTAQNTAEPAFAGVWRGASTCTSDASACRNETVVYYIKSVPEKPQVMFVRADKIVGGNAIIMGSGEWEYDGAGKTLAMRSPHRTWRLKFNGQKIEGTLTLADGTVFRKMTLKKDQ